MDDLIFAQEPADKFVQDKLAESAQAQFEEFLLQFSLQEADSLEDAVDGPYYYLEEIKKMVDNEKTTIYIDFQHVTKYDVDLAEAIETLFYRLDPYLRKALQTAVKKHFPSFVTDEKGDKEFWVSFYNQPVVYKIRELRTNKVGRLCSIRGTVTRTSEVRPELVFGTFQCMDCRVTASNVEQQFRYTEPPGCKNPSCENKIRWQLLVDSSKFVDWQKVRVQENSDEIPSGSMPRSLDVILRHEEVEKAKAGDKCLFVGTLIVVPDMSRGRVPGPKANGYQRSSGSSREGNDMQSQSKDYSYKLCFLACSVQPVGVKFGSNPEDGDMTDEFSEEEMQQIEEMKGDSKVYKKLIDSIAPAVFGHKEVKKGILLMLFGGVHKVTMEGINLRGDINVCIVGDPSTSKSQFLKYIVSFLPRAVYTSGKASSAAGLTATVVRDSDTGEFNIEAGALMLADNGICCIDEFDKMDPKDQVAIHEAMEQQTISIAKAGIHATLNARTSILAAANPIGGRYDKSKTLKTNLNVTPAIMSRFDLFFVVLDECDETTDHNIAQHIVALHQRRDKAITPDYSTQQLQRYIKYAKSLKPMITEDSGKLFVEHYRKLRQNDVVGHGKTAYRITVRQLESMIRLSEAMARVHCDEFIRPEYVIEAADLLRKSIIHVETGDVVFDAPTRPPPQVTESDSEEEMEISQQKGKDKSTTAEEEDVRKEKMVLSWAKYNQITQMIAFHLQPLEEQGIVEKDLIQWYIEQIEDDIASEAELIEQTTIVKKVIERLVSKEKVLLVIQESTTSETEDRVLQLHPNYNPEK